jgi:hypothetical protein
MAQGRVHVPLLAGTESGSSGTEAPGRRHRCCGCGVRAAWEDAVKLDDEERRGDERKILSDPDFMGWRRMGASCGGWKEL